MQIKKEDQVIIDPVRLRKRRTIGYLTRGLTAGVVNGYDTGATGLKAFFIIKLVLGGITTAAFAAAIATFAPFVFVAGLAFGLIYLAVYAIDEYFRNKKEDKLIAELNKLAKVESLKFAAYLAGCKLDKDNQESMEDLSSLSDEELLKRILRAYLEKLGVKTLQDAKNLNAKRKKNGKLPNQESLIRLIERVTNLDSFDPSFAVDLVKKLNADPENDSEFGEKVAETLGFPYSKSDQSKDRAVKLPRDALQKTATTVKDTLLGTWKTNQALGVGFGVIIGGGILVGLLVAGAAITWPVIAVAGAFALLTATAVLVYNRYVDKSYRENTKSLETIINAKKTKISLIDKLDKISRKNFINRNAVLLEQSKIMRSEESVNEDEHEEEKDHLLADNNNDKKDSRIIKYLKSTSVYRIVTAKIPTSTKSRMITDIVAQSAYGVSIGLLVGLAVASSALLILAVVLPPLGIPFLAMTVMGIAMGNIAGASLIVGGILGGIFGLRVGYMFGKRAAGKTGVGGAVEEVELIEQGERRQSKFETRLNMSLKSELTKSKQVLVKELMESYQKYDRKLRDLIRTLDNNQAEKNRLQAKRDAMWEKVLSDIQRITGIECEENKHPKFFNKVAAFLRKDPDTRDGVKDTVTDFKKIYEDDGVVDPEYGNKSIFSRIKEKFTSGAANAFMRDHALPILGMITVALPLGFLLFTPFGLPLVATLTGVIIAVYAVYKVCEYRSKINKEKIKDDENKLLIIDRITKLNEHDDFGVSKEPTVSFSDVVTTKLPEEAKAVPVENMPTSGIATESERDKNISPSVSALMRASQKISSQKTGSLLPEVTVSRSPQEDAFVEAGQVRPPKTRSQFSHTQVPIGEEEAAALQSLYGSPEQRQKVSKSQKPYSPRFISTEKTQQPDPDELPQLTHLPKVKSSSPEI